jgi:hypothetical protein
VRFYGDHQATRETLSHRTRWTAHARFQLTHGISDAADVLGKLILGQIELSAAPTQPRPEKRVVGTVGLRGLVARHFVTLSVDQTMTTGQRACGLLHSSPDLNTLHDYRAMRQYTIRDKGWTV